MTNHYVKYEDLWSIVFKIISENNVVYRQTNRQTDISKTIYHLFFDGGHNKKYQPRQLKLLRHWSETLFMYKVNITLTFDF
jgi:hypothetical protein